MATISPQDAIELANLFNDAAEEVGQYQTDHWNQLSKEERKALTKLGNELLNHGQDLITDAVGVMLDDAQVSLTKIKEGTAEANKAIKTIGDIKKVISLAASIVTLGTAIASGNISGIADAVTDVVEKVGSQPSDD